MGNGTLDRRAGRSRRHCHDLVGPAFRPYTRTNVACCHTLPVGFLFVGQANTALLIILALTVVNVGISAAKAPLWAMPSAFLSGAGAAAGIAMINSVGNLGGFVGPFAIGWLKSVTGGYTAGLYVVAGTLAVSAALTLLLSYQAKRPKRSALSPQPHHDR